MADVVYKIGSNIIRSNGGGGAWRRPDNAFGIVSRSLSAAVSSGTAANLVSSNYNNIVTSSGTPLTAAIDISPLSAAQKASMALYWYNDASTLYFDFAHKGAGGDMVNCPTAYTIQANTAAGGGAAPGSGWTTLVTVATNDYTQREHLLDLTGYNWVRMNITSSSDTNVGLKIDLYDVSAGNRGLMMLGDSRFYFQYIHSNMGASAVSSMGDLVAAGAFGKVVPQINGGMSGFKVADILSNISTWLALFPGCKYWALNIGINDATASPWFSQWDTDLAAIIQAILNAGRIPLVETIGWSGNSGVNSNILTYNSHIASVIASKPGSYAGYDRYAAWFDNQSWESGDNIHLTDAGNAADRANSAPFYSTFIAAH